MLGLQICSGLAFYWRQFEYKSSGNRFALTVLVGWLVVLEEFLEVRLKNVRRTEWQRVDDKGTVVQERQMMQKGYFVGPNGLQAGHNEAMG